MTRPQAANRTRLYIVIGVLAVAVLVGLFFGFFRGGSSTPAAPTSASYPVSVQGVVVTVGVPTAPTTIDIYEDFLCPVCGRFESQNGGDLRQAVTDGKAKVRYHQVAILNRSTNPPGYSTRAANAAICAAEAKANLYPAYHDKLFADQPSEGSAGLTDQELIAMGQALGLGADFAQCVTSTKHKPDVLAATQAAVKDPSLVPPGSDGFGTPTVQVNGKIVNDWTDSSWLANAIK
ncbi:MAG: thioredoxin domain-containing protein [Pseudonocardia sp.]|nr:thioredoxin domain-containing protein [Pseudonocardia sp.]